MSTLRAILGWGLMEETLVEIGGKGLPPRNWQSGMEFVELILWAKLHSMIS